MSATKGLHCGHHTAQSSCNMSGCSDRRLHQRIQDSLLKIDVQMHFEGAQQTNLHLAASVWRASRDRGSDVNKSQV